MMLKYENSIEDVVAFNRHHMAHSPTVKRAIVACMVLTAVLIIVGSFFAPLSKVRSREVTVGIGIVSAVLVSLLFTRIFPLTADWMIRRVFKEGANKNTLCLHELEIDEDGVIERTELGESRASWLGIEQITETDTHAFLFLSATSAHVIPKYSIIAGDAERFIARAKQMWDEKKLNHRQLGG